VRGPGQRAGRQCGGDLHRPIDLADRAERQHDAGRNAHEGLQRVPDRVETGNLVGKELDDE
jgi:hypothetical protein